MRCRSSLCCLSPAEATRISVGSSSRSASDIIRPIPALWIIAIVLKVLLLANRTFFNGFIAETPPALDYLERAINLALIVLACIWIYRLRTLARAGLLWRVSRKLILSYVLIGAVPILLLITFSLLGFLLVFFDVSSYLVHNGLTALTEQATTFARTTLFEIERSPLDNRQEIVSRRQSAIATRYPGVSVAVVPTGGEPACGVPPSNDLALPTSTAEAILAGSWEHVAVPRVLPRWVSCRGFGGLILNDSTAEGVGRLKFVARAAVLPAGRKPAYAVIVDLPVDQSLRTDPLEVAGIGLGERRPRSLFNTATFLAHTDWQHGHTGRTALSMSVDVGALYRWLGGAHDGGATVSFNQVLLYALLGIGMLLLVIEMIALGNGLALARSITGSVDELFGGTERVKQGDFQHPIAVRADDQLGELAASFNDMTRSIRELLIERDEKRRLEEELRIAREIQMSLLPQGPLKIPGLSVAALCAPAREVGGDYYDLLPLEDGRLGLLIADVAGKGTSAALYMAELKGLMLSLSRIHTSPAALLIEANRIISHHLDNRSFITMIYALVDPQKKILTCARAGHTPFIRIPARTEDNPERCARVLAPDGMVLGLNLDRGERFERALKEVTIPLQAGDLFFFFTDGISEAMNREETCFGESRLTAFLERHAELSPENLRDRLLEELAGFVNGQPQHDDITMIILKVNDTAGLGIRD